MKDNEQVELSPEFRAALERLPRGAAPSRGLEARMVRALKSRGLVAPGGGWAVRSPSWAAALRVAASLAIFAAGVAFGHRLGGPSVPVSQVARADASAFEMASLVQRTGSVHAAALGDLAARMATARPEDLQLAREVAMSSLRAAMWQVALLDPENPVPARLLRDLQGVKPGDPMPIRVSAEPLVISF